MKYDLPRQDDVHHLSRWSCLESTEWYIDYIVYMTYIYILCRDICMYKYIYIYMYSRYTYHIHMYIYIYKWNRFTYTYVISPISKPGTAMASNSMDGVSSCICLRLRSVSVTPSMFIGDGFFIKNCETFYQKLCFW